MRILCNDCLRVADAGNRLYDIGKSYKGKHLIGVSWWFGGFYHHGGSHADWHGDGEGAESFTS